MRGTVWHSLKHRYKRHFGLRSLFAARWLLSYGNLWVFLWTAFAAFYFPVHSGKSQDVFEFFLFPRTCVFGKINGNELYPRNVGNRLDNSLPKTIWFESWCWRFYTREKSFLCSLLHSLPLDKNLHHAVKGGFWRVKATMHLFTFHGFLPVTIQAPVTKHTRLNREGRQAGWEWFPLPGLCFLWHVQSELQSQNGPFILGLTVLKINKSFLST